MSRVIILLFAALSSAAAEESSEMEMIRYFAACTHLEALVKFLNPQPVDLQKDQIEYGLSALDFMARSVHINPDHLYENSTLLPKYPTAIYRMLCQPAYDRVQDAYDPHLIAKQVEHHRNRAQNFLHE